MVPFRAFLFVVQQGPPNIAPKPHKSLRKHSRFFCGTPHAPHVTSKARPEMKLATLDNGTRDGTLIVVRRDNTAHTSAVEIAPTDALDRWDEVVQTPRASGCLEAGDVAALPVATANLYCRCRARMSGSTARSPQPRSPEARNAECPRRPGLPGGSASSSPTQDIPLPNRLGPRLRI